MNTLSTIGLFLFWFAGGIFIYSQLTKKEISKGAIVALGSIGLLGFVIGIAQPESNIKPQRVISQITETKREVISNENQVNETTEVANIQAGEALEQSKSFNTETEAVVSPPRITQDAIELAKQTIMSNKGVRNAAVGVNEDATKVILAIQVKSGIDTNDAMELGDSFARLIATFCSKKGTGMPTKTYLGAIYDHYDLVVVVSSISSLEQMLALGEKIDTNRLFAFQAEPEQIIGAGAKSKSDSNLHWKFRFTN